MPRWPPTLLPSPAPSPRSAAPRPRSQTCPSHGWVEGETEALSTPRHKQLLTLQGLVHILASPEVSPDLLFGVRPPPRHPQSPSGIVNGTSVRLALCRVCLSRRLRSLRAEISFTHGRCPSDVCGGEVNKPQCLRSYCSQRDWGGRYSVNNTARSYKPDHKETHKMLEATEIKATSAGDNERRVSNEWLLKWRPDSL